MSKNKSFGQVRVRTRQATEYVFSFSDRRAYDKFVAHVTVNSTPHGYAIVDNFFGLALYKNADEAIEALDFWLS